MWYLVSDMSKFLLLGVSPRLLSDLPVAEFGLVYGPSSVARFCPYFSAIHNISWLAASHYN